MFTLSQSQFRGIEENYRRQRRSRLAVAFKMHNVDLLTNISDEQLMDCIDLTIADGKALGITEDDDIIDCVAIGFILRDKNGNPEINALVYRVLNNQAWDARKRLDFIWTKILHQACRSKRV